VSPVDRLLEALDGVRAAGNEKWIARCPAHEDRSPSLSIGIGDDGRVLVHCFAGCSTQDIVSAVRLEVRDLFSPDHDADGADWSPSTPRVISKPPADLPSEQQLEEWRRDLLENGTALQRLEKLRGWTRDAVSGLGLGWDSRRIVFPARDAAGGLVGVARYLPGARPNGESKMLADAGSSRALWPAPETVDASQPVWLTEGEPDAVSLASLGLSVVGVPGTASWRSEWAARFSGRDVIVCMDCDDPGRALAARIGEDLLDYATTVRVLDLDTTRDDAHDVGDLVREAAEDGSDGRDALRSILERMAADATALVPEWPSIFERDLPTFPVDALPRAVADWATATAEHAQTPVDLPALAALGVLSGAALGGAVVDCGGWEEELGLYLLPAMPSGDRKSTVLRSATQPLRELAAERAEDAAPRIRELRSRGEVLEIRARNLTKLIAKENVELEERVEAERNLAEVGAELDQIGQPAIPRILADDATPEALSGLFAKHGAIAVLAAESALIDNLAGRYSEGKANLHLVCAAYSGEPTVVDRKGHDPERLDRPLLTIALVIQPHVLEALINHPTARSQGLVARFAYALPETRLGHRRVNAPRVRPEVSAAWAATVRRVARTTDRTDATSIQGGSVGSVPLSPVVRIVFSAVASHLLTELQEQIEPRLAPVSDLHSIADWAARHHGRVARIAGLLHLCEHAPTEPISEQTMRAALRIGDYLLEHGVAALTGPDQKIRSARRWLQRHAKSTVTLRELHRGPFGGKGPVDQAEALARSLEHLGALRRLPAESSGPGRPKSPGYAVNPQLLSTPALPVSLNGHERLATPDEEQLLDRAARLIGSQP
jgi:hypothetical protein